MDTTIADLYGTADNAVADLKKTLKSEGQWRDLFGPEKVVFQEWAFENAEHYKDGDKIDWIGAFYDWLEN